MKRQTDTFEARRVAPGLEATTVQSGTAPGQSIAPGAGYGYAAQPRSRTAWGPIWGGVIAAVSLFLLMEMFTIWVGWVTVKSGTGGIAGTGREWITWIVAVIAFFIGGIIATAASPVRGMMASAMNSFLVWALATALMVGASLLGAGLVFGAVGATVTRVLLVTPGHAAGSANLAGFAGDAQTAGFWAFITLLTTAVAAILGGAFGSMSDPVGYFDTNATTMSDRL